VKNYKMISWNVNGLRAALKKGFNDFVQDEDPDILCIQEIKLQAGQVELNFTEYHDYWNYATKKGYAGTAIFTKEKSINAFNDMRIIMHDNEGRVITLEYENFYLVNVYTPNSQRGLTRLEYRQVWDKDFLAYMKNLEAVKPIIFCGDLNVAHKEIDLARPKDNHHNAGFTDEEREDFTRIIDAGFIDTFREFDQEGGNYSWWSYMFNARVNNVGWRIDYFLISEMLKPNLKDAFILPGVMGSDHCPVGIEIGL